MNKTSRRRVFPAQAHIPSLSASTKKATTSYRNTRTAVSGISAKSEAGLKFKPLKSQDPAPTILPTSICLLLENMQFQGWKTVWLGNSQSPSANQSHRIMRTLGLETIVCLVNLDIISPKQPLLSLKTGSTRVLSWMRRPRPKQRIRETDTRLNLLYL